MQYHVILDLIAYWPHWIFIHGNWKLTHFPPGRCVSDIKIVISNSVYEFISWALLAKLISCECHRTLWWQVNIGFVDDLMPSAASHCLRQCWRRSVLPYGVIRPQIVNGQWCCSVVFVIIFTIDFFIAGELSVKQFGILPLWSPGLWVMLLYEESVEPYCATFNLITPEKNIYIFYHFWTLWWLLKTSLWKTS